MFKILRPLVFLLLSSSCFLHGQSATVSSEQAIQKVFEVLSAKQKNSCGLNCDSLLKIGAWESLAYVDLSLSFNLSIEDIKEAVPDYYQFKDGKLYFKLINPENYNEYGYTGQLNYAWEAQSLKLIDPKSKHVKDSWEVLYLDENYLALQMDDLRVFLSHIAPVH
tara:strand:+ start:14934 stop:15428 length:495 start_codon:yes stop_codon:yes gene_type:complete